MPYWKCFLWTAAILAAVCCVVALFDWVQENAPEWVLCALTLIFLTAIVAIVPWACLHK